MFHKKLVLQLLVLICLVNLGSGQFLPAKKRIPDGKKPEVINVLATGMLAGSHYKNEKELALALSREKDMNVTFYTSFDYDLDLADTETFHVYRFPFQTKEDIDGFLEKLNKDPFGPIQEWNNQIITRAFDTEEGQTHLKNLRKTDFHVTLGELMDFDKSFSEYFGTTIARLFLYQASPIAQVLARSPTQTSHTDTDVMPPVITERFKLFSFPVRAVNIIVSNIMKKAFKPGSGSQTPESFYVDPYQHQFIFGSGMIGLSEPTQMPQNTDLIFPMSSQSSKLNPKFVDEKLTDEYINFISEYESVILIAFGTTYMPSQETVMKLIDVMKDQQMSKYGVIFGIKRNAQTETFYDDILDKSPSNMLVKQFVPQKKLLDHENVRIFVTHCGANSVNEALYFNTPMLGLPVTADQPSICHKVEHFNYGVYAKQSQSKQEMIELFLKVLDPSENNVYKNTVKKISQISTFEEQRSGANVANIVRYSAKFGATHLYHIASQDKATIWQVYDLDILLIPILLFLIMGKKLVNILF